MKASKSYKIEYAGGFDLRIEDLFRSFGGKA